MANVKYVTLKGETLKETGESSNSTKENFIEINASQKQTVS